MKFFFFFLTQGHMIHIYPFYVYQTEYQWTYFNVNLLRISNYVFLRDYARSKLCVSMAVHSGCAIGDLMEDDLYNPFCTDGIDPLSLPFTAGEFFCIHKKLRLLTIKGVASTNVNFANFWRLKCFRYVYHFVVAPNTRGTFRVLLFFTWSFLWLFCTSTHFALDGLLWVFRVCF